MNKDVGLHMAKKRMKTREMLSSLCHKNKYSLKSDKYMTAIPT